MDSDDPLKGIDDGVLFYQSAWQDSGSEGDGSHIEMELDHPRMVRESVNTDKWALDPEVRKRINVL